MCWLKHLAVLTSKGFSLRSSWVVRLNSSSQGENCDFHLHFHSSLLCNFSELWNVLSQAACHYHEKPNLNKIYVCWAHQKDVGACVFCRGTSFRVGLQCSSLRSFRALPSPGNTFRRKKITNLAVCREWPTEEGNISKWSCFKWSAVHDIVQRISWLRNCLRMEASKFLKCVAGSQNFWCGSSNSIFVACVSLYCTLWSL